MPYADIPVYAAGEVVLVKTSGSIVIGKTQRINVKNVPRGTEITYQSKKKSVAVVSKNGKVTAVKAGTAQITVTVKNGADKTKLSYKLTVKKPALSKSSLTLGVNQGALLALKNRPVKSAKVKYKWSSEMKW